jgi:hypothetical protein
VDRDVHPNLDNRNLFQKSNEVILADRMADAMNSAECLIPDKAAGTIDKWRLDTVLSSKR